MSDWRSTGTCSVHRSIFNAVYPCVVFQRSIELSALLRAGRGAGVGKEDVL